MLDDVVAALKKDARFSAWQVTFARGRSTQRYQVFNDVESRRAVESRTADVRVHVQHADGTLGESSFTIVDAHAPLAPALDAAHARARLVKNKPWTLPSPEDAAAGAAPVRAVDPRIVEVPVDAAEEVGGEIVRAVKAAGGGVELSASEVFCDYRRLHLVSSRGLDVTREETSAYTEYVLLARSPNGKDELEVYQSRRARVLQELSIAEQIAEDVEAAHAGARAVLPDTGTADVVLGGAGTEEIFDAFVAHACGPAKFDGWSRLVEGQPVAGSAADGYTPLTLSSDATKPFGLGTFAFDDVGLPGRRIDVIVDGVFKTRACDQRYGCWLGVVPTGSWGNTVVRAGTTTEAELLRPARGRPLYQLLRFSQLSPHATTGAFSGEIRFGYRIDGAGKVPIRGGSVSGVVFDAFSRARFSSETAIRGRTHGPRSIRFDSVQITGG